MEDGQVSQPHSDHGYSCGDPSSTASPQIKMPFLEKLLQLREKQLYCDLVIEVKAVKFYCHRAVVAAWSPYIHSMLNMKNIEREVIKINFNNVAVFAAVLDYMYTTALDLREVNLIQVLHLATSFQVQPLRDMCEGSLRCNLHVGNIISTFQLARKFQLSGLEDYSLTYLQMHLPEAVKQNDFLNLSAVRFNTFLSSGYVINLKPEVKLFLIISWLGYDVKEREQYFVVLLGHIDWSTVANDFLMEISQTENFFTTNESSLYLLLQTLHSSGISLGPYTNAFSDLRSKYSYLLSQVVQSSIWKTAPEVFSPVTVCLVTQQQVARPKPVNAGISSVAVQTDSDSAHKLQQQVDSRMLCVADVSEDRQLVLKSEEGSLPEAVQQSTSSCDLPKRRSSGRKSSKPKKIPRMKKRLTKGLKRSRRRKAGLRGLEEEADIVTRRESSRVPKPVVYDEFDNGDEVNDEEDNTAEEPEELLEDDDENDPDFTAGRNQDGDLSPTGECDGENEEVSNFHKLAQALQLQQQDDDDDDEEEEEEEEDEEDENNGHSGQQRFKRKRGRPKKGTEPIKPKCEKCSYIGKNEQALRNHMRRIHEEGLAFKCAMCPFECQWSKEYYSHCKEHYGEPPYHCDFEECNQTFDKIHLLLNHKDRHTDERRWACDQCPARFRARNNLTSHKRSHTGEKPFECNICHRSFATKNTMNQHKVTHSDDRPYLCDTCGFATKYQSHLIAHRRIHSGDVYHCHFPQCTYVTPKRSQLKAHMRSHLGIRRHVCPTCGKAFVEKSHLVRHERIHLDQKPFKCNECDYNSARIDKLKDHILRHHGSNSPEKSKYPTVRRPRKPKSSAWPVNVVPLPHPPLADQTEDPANPIKQNPQPLVLSEHGYVRMTAPTEDGSQITHGRHPGPVLDIPPGLSSQQQSMTAHVHQQAAMLHPPPPASGTHPTAIASQSQAPSHMQVLPTIESVSGAAQMTSYVVPTTSSVLVSSHNTHQHQQHPHQHHQQQHHQQQQQQQQPQPDYGGLGAFMALF
ncbi:uncharacterized protein [Haliotis cracherodii]|uniref:uncharacterized protein n=1 Tax=Haliotis cracherodii TaxID=6455 RepID=UPI0039EA4E62